MPVQGDLSDPHDSPRVHVLRVVHQLNQNVPGPTQNTDPSRVPMGHQGGDYRPAGGQNHQSGNLDPTAVSNRVGHSGGPGMLGGDSHQLYTSGVAGSTMLQVPTEDAPLLPEKGQG